MSLDNIMDREFVPRKNGVFGLGKSKIVVPKEYNEKRFLSGIGKKISTTALSLAAVATLTACPVNGGNGPNPPVCETNPAVLLAEDYGLPQSIVDAIAPLGDDCIVDSNESKLITELLPGILQRSNEEVALSYPERFVGDDGKFDEAENITMSRFLLGRYDREGLLVHPGYFQLVDDGHVQIPNAYFMSIFEMPFRFDIFPGANNGGKALPIVADKPYLLSSNAIDRSLTGNYISWQELSREFISPEVASCGTDGNFASMQVVFNNNAHDFPIDKLEVVNPFQVPARVSEIGFLINANDNRNAWIRLVPEYWPSSLGHLGLQVSMSHLDDEDIEASGLNVDDVIPVEGRIGRLEPDFQEWRLIFSYRSDDGFYREGDADKDSRFKVVDVFDPQPYNPTGRGLVWPVYYESVRSNGVPDIMNLGARNSNCQFFVEGERYFGNHPNVPPMKYVFPLDTRDR